MARERYEGLRAELDVLGRNGVANGVASGNGSGEVGGGDGGDSPALLLLPLLRARERRRKLGAVERAVEAVEREGKGVVGAKIDEVVKRAVWREGWCCCWCCCGMLPPPPTGVAIPLILDVPEVTIPQTHSTSVA